MSRKDLRRRAFMGGGHLPDKKCPSCPDRFYTRVGLDEHVRLGIHSTQDLAVRWITGRFSPAGLAVQQAHGRHLAAATNARRRRCGSCDLESTPAGVGAHQKSTGHTGWSELELATA